MEEKVPGLGTSDHPIGSRHQGPELLFMPDSLGWGNDPRIHPGVDLTLKNQTMMPCRVLLCLSKMMAALLDLISKL